MTVVFDYVKTLIPVNWKSSPSGWTSGNCPMCVTNGQSRPDTKGRGGFYFELDKFQYNCFNCGYKTGYSQGGKITNRLERLLKTFGGSENDIQKLKIELLKEADVAEILVKKQEKKNVVIDWPEITLPENTKYVSEWTEDTATDGLYKALTYLADRNLISMNDNFMYSTATKPGLMKNRIIIPFTYNNKVVGYTARWIGNVPEGTTKYFNKTPKNFVYGLDKQKNKEIVIVTEGQIDAIITDGVAIGSNDLNEQQANIIDSLNKRVIVLADADKAGMKLVNAAIKYGWEVSFPEWQDCKDAGDAAIKYGRLFTVKSIIESAVKGNTKIKIMAKGYCV